MDGKHQGHSWWPRGAESGPADELGLTGAILSHADVALERPLGGVTMWTMTTVPAGAPAGHAMGLPP